MGLLCLGVFMKKILILFLLLALPVFATESVSNESDSLPLQNKENKSTSDTEQNTDVIFKPYMKNLQKKIEKNWNPFHASTSVKSVIYFKINKDGTIDNCSVVKSSGIPPFDTSTLNAIRFSAPFAPLPKEYKGDSVDIEFTFDYNVWGSTANTNTYSNINYKQKVADYTMAENSPSKILEKSFKSQESKKVFKNYMKDVHKILGFVTYNNYKPSIVRIKFSIQKDGTVADAKVNASNGNKAFNNEVLEQVQNSQFGPIPSELNLEFIPVEYQFNNYFSPKPKTVADYLFPQI